MGIEQGIAAAEKVIPLIEKAGVSSADIPLADEVIAQLTAIKKSLSSVPSGAVGPHIKVPEGFPTYISNDSRLGVLPGQDAMSWESYAAHFKQDPVVGLIRDSGPQSVNRISSTTMGPGFKLDGNLRIDGSPESPVSIGNHFIQRLPVSISAGSKLGDNVVLGSRVDRLAPEITIHPSVSLGNGTRLLGGNIKLFEATVGPGVTIKEGAQVYMSALGKGSQIGERSYVSGASTKSYAHIGADAQVLASQVGKQAEIGEGAIASNSTLGDRAEIGAGAKVTYSKLGSDVFLAPGRIVSKEHHQAFRAPATDPGRFANWSLPPALRG
ncbi:MAG: hypothetical protein JST44_11220 [Cyanobacteria bacterium SZAS LIN-5]|nr:hypothetical protein [Cyanobacteria bacterium SZAS LIN-5]